MDGRDVDPDVSVRLAGSSFSRMPLYRLHHAHAAAATRIFFSAAASLTAPPPLTLRCALRASAARLPLHSPHAAHDCCLRCPRTALLRRRCLRYCSRPPSPINDLQHAACLPLRIFMWARSWRQRSLKHSVCAYALPRRHFLLPAARFSSQPALLCGDCDISSMPAVRRFFIQRWRHIPALSNGRCNYHATLRSVPSPSPARICGRCAARQAAPAFHLTPGWLLPRVRWRFHWTKRV